MQLHVEGATLGELDLGEDSRMLKSGTTLLLKYCTILLDWNQSTFTVELISPLHLKTITHSVSLALAVNQ